MTDPANDDVLEAARWLATTPNAQLLRPVLPHLQKQFGLSAPQAVAAIRESNFIRARAL